MMLGNTPMMIQYQEIKNKNEDSILFFRLGDFYEMFGEDALKASKILDIALTSREAGEGKRIPMCGVPYHSAENYIAKLIQSGHKVAICEQVEDPKTCKGIVKREVIRIITPGTVLEANMLQEKNNNYLVAITTDKNIFGLAAVDISTGDFLATEIHNKEELLSEVLKYEPAECIIPEEEEGNYIETFFSEDMNFNRHLSYAFQTDYCKKILLDHFQVNSLQSLGCSEFPQALRAAGAILDYLLITQKNKPNNLTNLKIYNLQDTMYLDYATKKNLELTHSLNTNDKHGSLLDVLDYTVTSLGARMLKSWLENPLINKGEIEKRLNITEIFYLDLDLKNKIKKLLEPIYDLERITAKISFGSVNAKDLIALKNSLALIPQIKETLFNADKSILNTLIDNLDTLEELYELLNKTINDDPPFSLREGSLLKDGFNKEVDELREITLNGKQWIINLEQKERNKTGIKSLKVGYNRVFGYYIEVTKTNLDLVPEEYIRKQTLANAERYITPELKEMEAKVLGADERLKNLEYQIFVEIREDVKEYIPRILKVAKVLASLDCYISLAHIAIMANYVKPIVSEDNNFEIIKLRHPVVERKLEGQWFIPNDIYLNSSDQRFLIITGPNMGGKSTFCRSIALASIMMQIGSFIPAEKAELPIVDRVFARVGASDNLSTGQSTFMVEMNEVANIVNNSTDKSLIILDEVGRGTSTYDGLSIAWSLTEYIHSKIKAKTLFATHYHELTSLEEKLPGVKNFNVSVKEEGDKIVFLRKIVPGGADRSYGIHVAKLAGLPDIIINRANEILKKLETNTKQEKVIENKVQEQISFFPEEKSVHKKSKVLEELKNINIVNITPIEALNLLFQLQNKAKKEG